MTGNEEVRKKKRVLKAFSPYNRLLQKHPVRHRKVSVFIYGVIYTKNLSGNTDKNKKLFKYNKISKNL